MVKIDFSKEEKEHIIRKVQLYFSEEVGAYFYNRGLFDAQTVLESKIDGITEAFAEIEKPTDFLR